MPDLNALVDRFGGWASLERLALNAAARVLEGHQIEKTLTDGAATWGIQGTLSDVEGGMMHGVGPSAQITPGSPVGVPCQIVAFEADVTARLRGTVTPLDHVVKTDGVDRWIVDAPIAVYLGGAMSIDAGTSNVVSTTLAIAELAEWWDLSTTGIPQLADWGTFTAYDPPWAISRGGTGHREGSP